MISETDLKRLQQKLVAMMADFQTFCEARDIHFQVTYGTCLGAVRHHGIIPWDDDIDIAMSSEEYAKLEAAAAELQPAMFLQTRRTDPAYKFRIAKLRLCDGSKVYEKWDDEASNLHRGIYIDIFIMDAYGEAGKRLFELCGRLQRLDNRRRLLPKHSMKRALAGIGLVPVRGLQYLLEAFRPLTRRADGAYVMYQNTNTGAVYARDRIFGAPSKLEIDGIAFEGPSDPDYYLTKTYGDYMKLPPPEQRGWHMERVAFAD